ncbi:MAG: ABC transporter permease [Chloroflexi bacterium]|nr:ABC transporter permease [Chloroflexota bacterium]
MAATGTLARPSYGLSPNQRDAALRVGGPVIVALAGFSILLAIYGKNPLDTYWDVLHATFGSARGFGEVLVIMIPLMFCALAVAIPARIGLVNVGGEGQLYLGAVFAAFVPLTWPGLPIGVMLPLMLLAGFLGGGLWAGVLGFLRARGLLSEVLSTLLMNSVAGYLLSYLVFGVWRDPQSSNFPQSKTFPHAGVLPHFWTGRLHIGLFIALAAVALFWFILYKTRWGYEMRAIGGNPEAAKRSGIPIAWYIVILMIIGGGIAGIGGMAETSAIQGRLRPGFSSSYGYIGFLISWMAGHNPVLIVLMSFMLAIITSGRDVLQITQNLPGSAVNILMALILFVVLARRTRKAGEA